MKKVLLPVLFLLSSFSLLHAQELIPNGGFESFTTCPVGFSEFTGKVSTWVDPNTGSPDYMNACADPFPAGVPVNGVGFQVPHSGVAYSGMYAFAGTIYREFIQVQLVSPLVTGHTYLFSMYVVLHNKSQTAIDDVGAYFSVTAPAAAGTGMLTGSPVPQVFNPPGSVITDTLNWTLVSGTYLATGGEKYVTIGHLKSDASTTYLSLPYGTLGAYYYYDDVSLTEITVLPVTLSAFSGTLVHETTSPAVALNWTTASEINNCCFMVERSAGDGNFLEIGTVPGAHNSNSIENYEFYDQHPNPGNNYYRLRQQDFDGTNSFSQTICINNSSAEAVHVYSDNNTIHYSNFSGHDLIATLYSISGAKIDEVSISNGTGEWICSSSVRGLYILQMTDPVNQQSILTQKLFLN